MVQAGASRETVLHWAACEGDIEVVRMLLGKGAKVDAEDSQGQTAMDLASAHGNNAVVGLLQAWIAERNPDTESGAAHTTGDFGDEGGQRTASSPQLDPSTALPRSSRRYGEAQFSNQFRISLSQMLQ